ncbi:MAG: hypothetical protein AB7O67_11350 [Vicinamibacterales bacterium]
MRTTGLLAGVGLAVWGNYLPKLTSPWRLEDEPFDWHGVHRFVGQVAFFGGLTLAFISLQVPAEWLRPAVVGVMATSLALALGRKLLSVATYATSPPPVSPR